MKLLRMLSFRFRDCFVVEMHQLWVHENGEGSNAMFPTLPNMWRDEFPLHRVGHHRKIFQRLINCRNSEDETSRELDAAIVCIKQLDIVILRQRFQVEANISINDQRFEILEAPKKLKFSDPIVRQVQVRDVIFQNLNNAPRNFLQALVCKRNSPISYFVEYDSVTFAASVNGKRTSYLLANYKPVDSLLSKLPIDKIFYHKLVTRAEIFQVFATVFSGFLAPLKGDKSDKMDAKVKKIINFWSDFFLQENIFHLPNFSTIFI